MFALLAQAADKADVAEKAADVAEKVAPEAASGWAIFCLMLAVVFVPYILGSLIGNALKLKEFNSRIGTVLFMVAVCLTPFGYRLYNADADLTFGERFAECFRLGIDLDGGTNLVYEIDQKKAKEKEEEAKKNGDLLFMSNSLDNMVGAIARRVNPSGTEEVTVRRVGNERIEVIIPGADQAYVDEMKDRITRLGTLEFEILATNSKGSHREIIRAARKLPLDENRIFQDDVEVARWVDVVPSETISNGGEVLPAETRDVVREEKNDKGQSVSQQALVVLTPDEDKVSGEFLIRAGESMDPSSGRRVVTFQFDAEGGARMGELTTAHRKQADGKHRLAILLDGMIQSAPSLNTTIEDRGQIEGQFTPEEIRELVAVLNAGALDVPLNMTPISEFTISPTLGADIRQKGVTAIIISAIAVVVAMGFYYLKAGLIAVVCLALNLLLIMGAMVFVQGTFTLPGLAGLVLTIGMAVDANVLIFERIREEIDRGASIRMAIHNGFEKAFTAIIDSNLTTLIVAVILFMIGTDQVKGFAVTLFIGIVMSMFSALYFGRTVFEILEKKRMLTSLKMLSIVKSPNWDFVGKQMIALAVSVIAIAMGLGAFIYRGDDNLDIDFRGGTMVTFEFTEDQTLTSVRESLKAKDGSGKPFFDDSITIERLTIENEQSQLSDQGRRWRLRVPPSQKKKGGQQVNEVEVVQSRIAQALGTEKLKKVKLAFSSIEQIQKTETVEGEEARPNETEGGFEGGWTTELTFSDKSVAHKKDNSTEDGDDSETTTDFSGVTTSTASRSLVEALRKAGEGKFSNPENLFRLEGIEGDGMDAEQGQVETFTRLRLDVRSAVTAEQLTDALNTVVAEMDSKPYFEEVQKFSQVVGKEMKWDAGLAMFFSLLAIVAYIWLRFRRVTFGLAAVVALVHDVAVVLGIVAIASLASGNSIGQLLGLYDFKINLPMIAAFLTIVGYSLNDTIVIFDRIREVRGKNPSLTSEMINRSLNQTLARTLMTSITTFLVVFILYVWGGEGIHGFAFCLLVGVIVGTYSSIYVASPVLLYLMNRAEGGQKATEAA